MLVIFLWLSPIIIGASQPSLAHVYDFWGNIEYIISNGHLSVDVNWYHSWPGSWLLYGAIISVTGIENADTIIAVTPFIWQLLYIPILYLLLVQLTDCQTKNFMWAGLWLFFLGDWVGQNYLSAESLAFLIYLILIALFIMGKWYTKFTNGRILLLFLLFAVLSMTHLLTSLVFLVVAFIFFIRKRISRIIFFSLAGIVVLWNVYIIATILPHWGPGFFQNVFNISELLESSVVQRFQGNQSRIDVVTIRLETTLLFLCICLLGFFVSALKDKKRLQHFNTLRIITGLTLVVLVLGIAGGFEVPYRIFLFMLPIAAFFGARLLQYKYTVPIVFMFIILLFPLNIISQYGNQIVDYQSSMDIAALKYFHTSADRGYVTAANDSVAPFGSYENTENYVIVNYALIIWQPQIFYNSSFKLSSTPAGSPLYIPFGQRDLNTYDFLYNDTSKYSYFIYCLEQSPTNLAYTNGNMNLFVCQDWVSI